MRVSSRLSTSANWELISSWTESRAASTMSPEVCARSSFSRLKSPASALRNASRRLMSIWRMLRIASLRLIGVTLASDTGRAEGLPPSELAVEPPSRLLDRGFDPYASGDGPDIWPIAHLQPKYTT